MPIEIELSRVMGQSKEEGQETNSSESNPKTMDDVDHPPGPGPGFNESHSHEESSYLPGPPICHFYNPSVTTRMTTNNFIGITPPPMPMMDYQSDHSSTFTQTFLRGILTSIDSKDPVVANAWLETLLDAIDLLPIDVIRQEIITIAIAKSQLSQPAFSRMASCKMLGKLSTKLDQQSVRQEVLPPTLALCQDVESDVRNCMCRHLAFVARGVGLDLTKSAILPVLVELSNDESADVRLSAIETVVHLLSLLDDEICNNTIVPLVIKSCEQAKSMEDCTLPVIARHLGRLCHGLTPNLSQTQKSWFIVFYQKLSKLGTTGSTEVTNPVKPMPDLVPRTMEDKTEKYIECRLACAYNLPGMVLFVGAVNFTDQLFSTFCDFATDPSPSVRKTLASSLHELIKIIGINFSLTKMQIVALFNDSSIDVLSAMVTNMVYVIDALARFGVLQFGSAGSYSQELSMAILHCEEAINSTRNWRLHADCLEKLSCLANCISATVIQQRYIPLLFNRAHKARPLPCRLAAVRTILVILRFTVKIEDRTNIMFRIKQELAHGKSCHSRMLFLKMCEMAIMLYSKTYFKHHFFSELLCLSQDSVANIRLKVVSLLAKLKSLLSLPSDHSFLQHLEEVVKELLLVERDSDVLSTVQATIQTLAEVETGVDGILRSGAAAEEDRDDERKLREERLIANMEEQIKQINGTKLEQMAIPSAMTTRLRSLGMDRKRSESLPPAYNRADLPINVKPRYNSPEPPRTIPSSLPKPAPVKPTNYSPEMCRRNMWQPELPPRQNIFQSKTNLNTPYSSSLENLDPSTQEFLVDAGVNLDVGTGSMASAASMPNLTDIGKTKEQISRSNSTPEKTEGDISKYLISNAEMEMYEAEYHATKEEPDSCEPPLTVSQSCLEPPQKARGRPETKMRAPSFTSALTNKPSMLAISKSSVTPVTKPIPMFTTKPTLANQNTEMKSHPYTNSLHKSPKLSRISPVKSGEKPASQKWNDGSIERLAEKWQAKRDILLKETGVFAENLHQRKAAMEQKLASVKQSIPKRSLGFTPQSAQKRLSLCESSVKNTKPSFEKDESPKRKSLDVDLVLAPETDPVILRVENNNVSTKLNQIKSVTSPPTTKSLQRRPSPDLGSSDSDDSLPPYPNIDKQKVELDQPLPPPPESLDRSFNIKNIKSTVIVTTSTIPSAPTIKPIPRMSSFQTFKTLPPTAVAVSRSIPAPQRSIADSPRLPSKYVPEPKSIPTSQVGLSLKHPSTPALVNQNNELKICEKQDESSVPVVKSSSLLARQEPSSLANLSPHSSSSLSRKPNGGLAASRPTSRLNHFIRKKPPDNYTVHSSDRPGLMGPSSSGTGQTIIKSGIKQQKRPTPTESGKQPVENASAVSILVQPATPSQNKKPVIQKSQIGKGLVQSTHSTPTSQEIKPTIYFESHQSRPKGLRPPQSFQLRHSKISPEASLSTVPLAQSAGVGSGKTRYGKSLSADSILDKNQQEVRSQPPQPPRFLQPPDHREHRSGSSSHSSSPNGSSENLLTPDSLENMSIIDSPSQLSPTSAGRPGRTGIIGPRKSSGMRMWQGQKTNRRAGSVQASPVTSRSPSPSSKLAAANNVPGRLAGDVTLPRSSALSRRRAPVSQNTEPPQRRSYGGVPSYTSGKPLSYSSAPTTPRHSKGDLTRPSSIHSSPGGSRSSSPVSAQDPAKRRSSHYPGHQVPSTNLNTSINYKDPPSRSSSERSLAPSRMVFPTGLAEPRTQSQSMLAIRRPAVPRPSIPSLTSPRARLPNPQRSFAYHQR